MARPAPLLPAPGRRYAPGVDREPGEEIFFRGHPSWLSMPGLLCKGLLLSLVVGIASGLASAIVDGRVQTLWVIAGVGACAAVVLAIAQLHRWRVTYSVTSRRLTIETGLFSRHRHDTRLERVQNVSLRQSVLQRVLGVGTVEFEAADEMWLRLSFRGVENPRRIVRAVDHALHALADRHGRHPAGV